MRLIDADELKKKKRYSMEYRENVVAVAEIDWMPTVDAVPVVRCKDCKWYRQDIGWCNRNAGTWAADDYCTHAEWRGYDAVD